MIESRIKNELSLKRYRRFKSQKLSVIGLVAILIISLFSFTAEFWANSKPIIMKYKGSLYLPVLSTYHPSEFGIEGEFITNYRELEKTLDDSSWMFWPIVKWDPFESNKMVNEYPSPPSTSNWLGTDSSGRDIFARILYGYRYSIAYAFFVWLLSTVFGIVTGGIMGFFGGKTDLVGQRITEILSTVPQFFLLLIIISIFEPSLIWLIVISSAFGWIFISYYIRAEFLKNRKREFTEAARSIGASKYRIIFKHILPNSLTPVITFAPFLIATHISALASLDYLGFGLTPPTPSWGELLNQAKEYFSTSWWLAVFPSLALFLTLLLLNLVGRGVQDALDPRK